MSRIAVVGSRDYKCLDMVGFFMARLPWGTTIVSGGASGVDDRAERAARGNALEVEVHRPDYSAYKPHRAPLVRNEIIAERCDELVAFWNGKSTGTLHVIREAVKRGKHVRIFADTYGPMPEASNPKERE